MEKPASETIQYYKSTIYQLKQRKENQAFDLRKESSGHYIQQEGKEEN